MSVTYFLPRFQTKVYWSGLKRTSKLRRFFNPNAPDRKIVDGNGVELLKFFEGKTAKWQIPDDVVFVDAIPLGATGKMQKTKLREQLRGYKLPGL